MAHRVGVVILNWHNWRDTRRCLASLRAMQYNDDITIDLIVVDNGSTDESLAELRRETGITLIALPANRGFAGGCNPGIRAALGSGCDYVLLINSDTTLPAGFLEPMVRLCENDPRAGVVCPKICYEDDLARLWYAGGRFRQPRLIGIMVGLGERDRGQYDRAQLTDFGVGCCMLIRREVFDQVGYLDERFFFYQEDVDFSIRAARAGFGVWYQPAAVIYHGVARSTAGNEPRRSFLAAASRPVFFAKHIHGPKLLVVIGLEVGRLVRRSLAALWQGQPNVAASYLRGTLAGLRQVIAHPTGAYGCPYEAGQG